MKTVKNYFREVMRTDQAPVSLAQMLLCGFATGLPLLVGLYQKHLTVAIYGALVGYLLVLNDHLGSWRHRLWVTTVTFATLLLGILLGLFLQNRDPEMLLSLAVLTYWIGLMGSQGAEMEKALLYSTIYMIIAAHTKSLSYAVFPVIFPYALLGYIFVMAGVVVHSRISKRAPDPYQGLFASLKLPLSSKLELHFHAFSYMTITLLAAVLIRYYGLQRGYWTVITVLLVMKPDRTQSIYRSFQRLIGTCLGVLAADGLMSLFHTPLPVIFGIMICGFFVPWGLKRNYWLVSFLISIIVILLLDLNSVQSGDFHTPILRLQATAFGCLLSAAGVLLSKGLEKIKS